MPPERHPLPFAHGCVCPPPPPVPPSLTLPVSHSRAFSLSASLLFLSLPSPFVSPSSPLAQHCVNGAAPCSKENHNARLDNAAGMQMNEKLASLFTDADFSSPTQICLQGKLCVASRSGRRAKKIPAEVIQPGGDHRQTGAHGSGDAKNGKGVASEIRSSNFHYPGYALATPSSPLYVHALPFQRGTVSSLTSEQLRHPFPQRLPRSLAHFISSCCREDF